MSNNNQECKVEVHEDVLDSAKSLVGAIDAGTSSDRFMLFTDRGEIAAMAQIEHTQLYPKPGWHEHDPFETWNKVALVIEEIMSKVNDETVKKVHAIGITNHRESTIAWNARTGVPYYNCIVWDDVRTNDIAKNIGMNENAPIALKGGLKEQDRLRERTGLPLASYFSGTKIRWLIENVPQLAKDLEHGNPERQNVRFGTIDTWLVYQLTGEVVDDGSPVTDSDSDFRSPYERGNVGGSFVTDVSNASRTLLMDLHTCQWAKDLVDTVLNFKKFPMDTALPNILPSSGFFGVCHHNNGLKLRNVKEGIPITSILGDQQAALFGQTCFGIGEAKCTYGTGLFLMMNTGKTLIPSQHGLLTTVGYKLGEDGDTVYALEGSVSHCGSVIQWLRDQLGIIENAAQSETYASQISSNEGLYFVPAFAGLFAPYWRGDARGIICGMTASHTKCHICRAAIEAMAYQTRELFDAIFNDSQMPLAALKVDGGAVANQLLMQFLSDMLSAPVVKPVVTETTAMGAAFAAGLAVGTWKSLEEIKQMWAVDKTWETNMDEAERDGYYAGWKKAVTKSFDWAE